MNSFHGEAGIVIVYPYQEFMTIRVKRVPTLPISVIAPEILLIIPGYRLHTMTHRIGGRYWYGTTQLTILVLMHDDVDWGKQKLIPDPTAKLLEKPFDPAANPPFVLFISPPMLPPLSDSRYFCVLHPPSRLTQPPPEDQRLLAAIVDTSNPFDQDANPSSPSSKTSPAYLKSPVLHWELQPFVQSRRQLLSDVSIPGTLFSPCNSLAHAASVSDNSVLFVGIESLCTKACLETGQK
ncbi:hypothetical protein GX51_00287 [Blastomyces parvus]|uniref:Uncharacterized protein n=1 Tax=Blastomyces parvus TaxID=2060905 RepID=A0A2B7XM60_9EURO|nr:hypothetical protein GX51_00287 [Blastomyces parvus]